MTSSSTVNYVESYQSQKNKVSTNLFFFYAGTMASSVFGPYHGLWHDNAPTKCIGLMPTPWTMADSLGLVRIHQAHEWLWLVPLLTFVFCDFLDTHKTDGVGVAWQREGVRVRIKVSGSTAALV